MTTGAAVFEENIRVLVRIKPPPPSIGVNVNRSDTISGAITGASADDPQSYAPSLTIDQALGKVALARSKKGSIEYTFQGVIGPCEDQSRLYEGCSDIVQDALAGVNCSIIAYGQTGSGKTYSMLGKQWTSDNPSLVVPDVNVTSDDNEVLGTSSATVADRTSAGSNERKCKDPLSPTSSVVRVDGGHYTSSGRIRSANRSANGASIGSGDDPQAGVIPRCLAELFDTLAERKSQEGIEFTVSIQLMQIYNEKIYDLLQDKHRENPLVVRETIGGARGGLGGQVYVHGLSEYSVQSRVEVMRLLKRGIRNRAVRVTEMNMESSRSHTILQVVLQVRDKAQSADRPINLTSSVTDLLSQPLIVRRSTLRFVDLAGSEKWRFSHNQSSLFTAEVQKEMLNINVSLHVLGNCVAALSEPGRRHIPYRDSVLTRILQDSLGGNGKTVIIATISTPYDAISLDESYNTLQFAYRASKIKAVITPSVEIIDDGLTLQAARVEIAKLREQVSILQHKLSNSRDRGGSSGEHLNHTNLPPRGGNKNNRSNPDILSGVGKRSPAPKGRLQSSSGGVQSGSSEHAVDESNTTTHTSTEYSAVLQQVAMLTQQMSLLSSQNAEFSKQLGQLTGSPARMNEREVNSTQADVNPSSLRGTESKLSVPASPIRNEELSSIRSPGDLKSPIHNSLGTITPINLESKFSSINESISTKSASNSLSSNILTEMPITKKEESSTKYIASPKSRVVTLVGKTPIKLSDIARSNSSFLVSKISLSPTESPRSDNFDTFDSVAEYDGLDDMAARPARADDLTSTHSALHSYHDPRSGRSPTPALTSIPQTLANGGNSVSAPTSSRCAPLGSAEDGIDNNNALPWQPSSARLATETRLPQSIAAFRQTDKQSLSYSITSKAQAASSQLAWGQESHVVRDVAVEIDEDSQRSKPLQHPGVDESLAYFKAPISKAASDGADPLVRRHVGLQPVHGSINESHLSKYTLGPSVAAPVSHGDSLELNCAPSACVRHGLVACMLCEMSGFSSYGSAPADRRQMVIEASSNTGMRHENKDEFRRNIQSSTPLALGGDASAREAGISKSSIKTDTSAPCVSHGVMSCLLCSWKRQGMDVSQEPSYAAQKSQFRPSYDAIGSEFQPKKVESPVDSSRSSRTLGSSALPVKSSAGARFGYGSIISPTLANDGLVNIGTAESEGAFAFPKDNTKKRASETSATYESSYTHRNDDGVRRSAHYDVSPSSLRIPPREAPPPSLDRHRILLLESALDSVSPEGKMSLNNKNKDSPNRHLRASDATKLPALALRAARKALEEDFSSLELGTRPEYGDICRDDGSRSSEAVRRSKITYEEHPDSTEHWHLPAVQPRGNALQEQHAPASTSKPQRQSIKARDIYGGISGDESSGGKSSSYAYSGSKPSKAAKGAKAGAIQQSDYSNVKSSGYGPTAPKKAGRRTKH